MNHTILTINITGHIFPTLLQYHDFKSAIGFNATKYVQMTSRKIRNSEGRRIGAKPPKLQKKGLILPQTG